MPLILAEELDTVTVQEIQDWDQRAGDGNSVYIDIIDKANLTTQRLSRLQRLTRKRDETSELYAVDADELGARLRHISSRRSYTPSDAPSTPVTEGAQFTEHETNEGVQRIAYSDYQCLKSIGGRPSREIKPEPAMLPEPDVDKRSLVSDHWEREAGFIAKELNGWLDFRWHQFKMRADRERLDKYSEAVYQYLQGNELDWTVELQLDCQTKVDEWREFYIYERWKRDALEKELDRAKKEVSAANKRVAESRCSGLRRISENILSQRATEMVRYRVNIARAQKEADMAQKRVEVLKVNESLSAPERDLFITQAEKDLEFAQKRLGAEKSDEMEQLRMEVQRDIAQSHLASCQGRMDHADVRLKELDSQLEWVNGQFAAISMEYQSSIWEGRCNRDLIEGWMNYYAYMRERLQAKQVREISQVQWYAEMGWERRELTEAEEAKEDLMFPQERARPLQALLAFIEREFPKIAPKDLLLGSSDQDHEGDRTEPPSSRQNSRLTFGKCTTRKRQSTRERSRLTQVRSSKVSKSSQKSTAHRRKKSLGHPHAGVHAERKPLKAPGWKGEQPSAALSLGSIQTSNTSSKGLPESLVRRSARILNRKKKTCSLASDSGKLATASQRSSRGTVTDSYTKPQGIMKPRRCKATSKKRSE